MPAQLAGPGALPWDGVVPEDDRAKLASSGFGADVQLGERPCLLVVDVTMSFLGRRPGDEHGEDWVTGCGPVGWERLPDVLAVLDAARRAGIPRVLTKGAPDAAAVVGGAIKLSQDLSLAQRTHAAPFPAELVPQDDEFVLEKTKASAFLQTPLLTFLHQQRIDSLLVVGTTTSGCVRATVVDACSYGYPVLVAHDACFDRSPFQHAANLFDIQMKYGSVVSAGQLVQQIDALELSEEGVGRTCATPKH